MAKRQHEVKSLKEVGKRVAFDRATWMALDLYARDSMKSFQELADEAFADLLAKHERPVDLPGRSRSRERRELIAGERLRVAQELGVVRGEVGVGGHAMTAVATSSIRAASS